MISVHTHLSTPRTTGVLRFLLALVLALPGAAYGQQPAPLQSDTASLKDLLNLQLEENQLRRNLDNSKVTTASKQREHVQGAPGLVTVISHQEIAAFGGNSLVDVLNRVIGIYVAGSYYFPQNLATLRGDLQTHTTSHVLILLDGRPLRESFYGGIDLAVYNTFPLAAIERIEIIRGPGSVLYGTNAFTGVINLITRQERKSAASLSGSGGSFGTYALSGSGSLVRKALQVQATARYLDQEGWDFAATDARGVHGNMPYGQRNLAIHARTTYKNWSWQNFYGRSHRDVFGELPLWREEVYRRLKTYRAFSDLGYSRWFTPGWQVSLNATYNGFSQRSWRDGQPVHFFSNDALLENTHLVKLAPGLNLVGGGLLNYVTGAGVPEEETGVADYVPAYGELKGSLYVQADYQAARWVKLIAGGQANKVRHTPVNLVPRLGSIFTLTPEIGAKVLYGEAYKSAAQSERYTLIANVLYGNPALKPEVVRTLEGQVYFQKPSYEFSAAYFHSRQRNTVQRVPYLDGAARYDNIGNLTTQGVELEGKVLPVQTVTVSGSMAYQSNTNNEGEKNTTTVPNLMAKGGVAYQAPWGLSVGVFDAYFSKPADVINSQTELPPSKQRLPVNAVPKAYHWLSLNLSLDVNKLLHLERIPRLSLQGYGENLLGEKVSHPEFSRRTINSLPARGGRAFYGGLTVGF
jgi:outer membrane receptor protein involved in Fe transport